MFNIPHIQYPRIVIVGAGFAGLMLARKLAKSPYQVVLLDRNNYHQFQPLFYQVAMAGLEPSSIAFPLRKIFQNFNNIFIRVAEITGVNTETKQIESDLGILKYDYLVIATGADTNFFGNQAIMEHAIPMKSVSEALYLRNKVLSDYEKALTLEDTEAKQALLDIVIVGGGPTGVEVAGALAEMKLFILPKEYKEIDSKSVDIYLLQGGDRLLNGMSDKAAASAERYLKELGVIIKYNSRVTNYDGHTVSMKDGQTILAQKVIWAAGISGNILSGIDASSIAPGNRFKVNAHNQIEGYDNVFAIGDIAAMLSSELENGHPQVAQVAIQQAKNLAANFHNIAAKKALLAFKYRDLGSMATIGRHKAVADLPGIKLQGFLAWFMWLLVHLFAIIGVKNKLFVFINWLWNYFTYDQSLRLIIRPRKKPL